MVIFRELDDFIWVFFSEKSYSFSHTKSQI